MAGRLTKLVNYTSYSIAHQVKTYTLWNISRKCWPRMDIIQFREAKTSSGNSGHNTLLQGGQNHQPLKTSEKLRFKVLIPVNETTTKAETKKPTYLRNQRSRNTSNNKDVILVYPSKPRFCSGKTPGNEGEINYIKKRNNPKGTSTVLSGYLKCTANKNIVLEKGESSKVYRKKNSEIDTDKGRETEALDKAAENQSKKPAKPNAKVLEAKQEKPSTKSKGKNKEANTGNGKRQFKKMKAKDSVSKVTQGVNKWLSALREHMAEAEKPAQSQSTPPFVKKKPNETLGKPHYMSNKCRTDENIKSKTAAPGTKNRHSEIPTSSQIVNGNGKLVEKKPFDDEIKQFGFNLKEHIVMLNEVLANNKVAKNQRAENLHALKHTEDIVKLAEPLREIRHALVESSLESSPNVNRALMKHDLKTADASDKLKKAGPANHYLPQKRENIDVKRSQDDNGINTPLRQISATDLDKPISDGGNGANFILLEEPTTKPSKHTVYNEGGFLLSESASTPIQSHGRTNQRSSMPSNDTCHLSQSAVKTEPKELEHGFEMHPTSKLYEDVQHSSPIEPAGGEPKMKYEKNYEPSENVSALADTSNDLEICRKIVSTETFPLKKDDSSQTPEAYWSKAVEEKLISMQTFKKEDDDAKRPPANYKFSKTAKEIQAEKVKTSFLKNKEHEKKLDKLFNTHRKAPKLGSKKKKASQNSSFLFPFIGPLTERQSKLMEIFWKNKTDEDTIKEKELKSKPESKHPQRENKVIEDKAILGSQQSVMKRSTSFSEPLLFVKPDEIVKTNSKKINKKMKVSKTFSDRIDLKDEKRPVETAMLVPVVETSKADDEIELEWWLNRFSKQQSLSHLDQAENNGSGKLTNLPLENSKQSSKKHGTLSSEKKEHFKSKNVLERSPSANYYPDWTRNFLKPDLAHSKEKIYSEKTRKDSKIQQINRNQISGSNASTLEEKATKRRDKKSPKSSIMAEGPNAPNKPTPEEAKKQGLGGQHSLLTPCHLQKPSESYHSKVVDASGIPDSLPSDESLTTSHIADTPDIAHNSPLVQNSCIKMKENENDLLEEWLQAQNDMFINNLLESGAVLPSETKSDGCTKTSAKQTSMGHGKTNTTSVPDVRKLNSQIGGTIKGCEINFKHSKENKATDVYDRQKISQKIFQDIQKTYLKNVESTPLPSLEDTVSATSLPSDNTHQTKAAKIRRRFGADTVEKVLKPNNLEFDLGEISTDKTNRTEECKSNLCRGSSSDTRLINIDSSRKHKLELPVHNLDGFITMELQELHDQPEKNTPKACKHSCSSIALGAKKEHRKELTSFHHDLYNKTGNQHAKREVANFSNSGGDSSPHAKLETKSSKLDTALKDALNDTSTDLRELLAQERLKEHRLKQQATIAFYEKNIMKHEEALERYRDRLRRIRQDELEETASTKRPELEAPGKNRRGKKSKSFHYFEA